MGNIQGDFPTFNPSFVSFFKPGKFISALTILQERHGATCQINDCERPCHLLFGSQLWLWTQYLCNIIKLRKDWGLYDEHTAGGELFI